MAALYYQVGAEAATPTPTPTPIPARNKLRVVEVRYLPTTPTNSPDDLSLQLQNMLRSASTFHGYSDPTAVPNIEVEVVAVYNHNTARPNPDNTWFGAWYGSLEAGWKTTICAT